MPRLKHCGCAPHYLDRQKRSWWMRLLFPDRMYFLCLGCGARVLLPSAPRDSVPPSE